MTLLPRCVLMLSLAASCAVAAFAQTPGGNGGLIPIASSSFVGEGFGYAAPSSNGGQVAPSSVGGDGWFLNHYGVGAYVSPLGIGGKVAVSLTHSLNLRAGVNDFGLSTAHSISGVPFTVNVHLQSEQASLDWYPFRNGFYVSTGILFGSSNRVSGSASIAAGDSFTLNNTSYYSSAADPVSASGSVLFGHTAPTFSIGWGNWIRRRGRGHLAFPFELGAAYEGDPKTFLNFSGAVCTDAAQLHCENIATDPAVQSNIAVVRKKLQNGADWASFYPIIAGGIVYRF